MWSIFFAVSLAILICSVVFAVITGKTKHKKNRILNPLSVLFAGVVLSSFALFLPIYLSVFNEESGCGVFEAVMISLHNMIRLFIVDGEFGIVTENLGGVSDALAHGYSILFSILFVAAPFLTFGFVLSFFKNIFGYIRFAMNYKSDLYVFSELNERSLALAQSLAENKTEKRFFVFTDVENADEKKELIEKAGELDAVCFGRDIVTIDLSFHSKSSKVSFFAIGNDESQNVSLALKIVDKFRDRENTELFVVASRIESEMILSGAYNSGNDQSETKIHIRRVNEVRSLVLRNLYEDGYEKIFESAYDDGSGIKKINAVVVGMGAYGTEMVKALSWFCQMDGYEVQIDAFDVGELAAERFYSSCPELMDKNGNRDIADDAKYTINIHTNVNVDTVTFDRLSEELPQSTYVFISLGSDEQNIAASVKLRALYERKGIKPVIQTVVYDTDKKESLCGVSNFGGKPFNIDFIGDIKSSFSEKVIISSDLEAVALGRHLKWGEEKDFWKFDYNYKSSLASAIHREMKRKCGIPGIEKKPEDRTDSEKQAIRILEHNRWNAYMRSEGYVYGGSIERAKGRNDLAKMHNCLVPFYELPLKEQEKDDD